MSKEITTEEALTAGAWYRLWKSVSARALIELQDNLHLTMKEMAIIKKAVEAANAIECAVGLETKCENVLPPDLKEGFCDLFYGDLKTPLRSQVDVEIRYRIAKITNELMDYWSGADVVN